jgi:Ca2+-dependent lipid-binding protein
MGKITVTLEKIANLADEDTIGKADPFVKFHLEQDNIAFDKNYGKKQSTAKKGQLNPVYNETFVWDDVETLDNLV